MSSSLYRLGRSMARAGWKAVGAWFALLLLIGGLAVGLGGAFSTTFEIPGTEGQEGLDELSQRFPEMGGTGGQLVFVTTDGSSVDDHQAQIEDVMESARGIESVEAAPSPFDDLSPGTRSDDGTAIIGNVQMDGAMGEFPESSVDELAQLAEDSSASGLEVHLGGQILQSADIPMGISEVIGIAAALMILAITFRAIVPATIPILSAIVGVGISILAVMALAAGIDIPSVTISLAAMLGLAVGIDYALFILSRHRDQLREGMEVEESIGEATATSGSAVIFAGMTVIIALVGLAVTRIPFLTIMGVAAAATVALSVVVALTMLPAFMGILGERLRPKRIRRLMAENGGVLPEQSDDSPEKVPFTARWVRAATKVPALTIILVIVVLGALAIPIKDLRLGLPDLGTEQPGTSARDTYDLVADTFGPGYNGPLLVTADIINSTDPLGVVEELEERIAQLPDVAEIQLATPNRGADLAVIVVIPEGAQTDESTSQLVRTMRDQAPQWEADLTISDVKVTGQTAVAIDISERLSEALLPFALFVVGLSLILLMIVFRSVWVPIKASLGYLLSVGAAFGIVAMVFEYGWGNAALNVNVTGPVIAFMPIMCMGILFGLAMDYEVFLVSRMREEFVHTGDADRAIERGFVGSAPVVIAAALIMFSVFASFVPHGGYMLQPIAIALAAGVLIDAFIVRMMLVPAVLALLGARAWWLPAWLDRLLPKMDVEGEGLAAVLEHRRWTQEHGTAALRLEDVIVPVAGGRAHAGPADEPAGDHLGPLTGSVAPGTLLVVRSADDAARTAFLDLASGRLVPTSGILAVHDRLAPDDLGAIQARVHRFAEGEDLAARLEEIGGARSAGQIIVVDDVADLAHAATLTRGAAIERLERLLESGTTLIAGSRSPAEAGMTQTEQSVVELLEDPSRHIGLRVDRAGASAQEDENRTPVDVGAHAASAPHDTDAPVEGELP